MSALPPKATSNATYGMPALGQKRTCHPALLPLADDLKYSQLGINFYFGSERNRLRNFLFKSRKHGQVRKGRTLHQNWIHGIEYKRSRRDAPRFHFVQHPCRRNAALGGVEN